MLAASLIHQVHLSLRRSVCCRKLQWLSKKRRCRLSGSSGRARYLGCRPFFLKKKQYQKNNSTPLTGSEGMTVSVHPLREPPGGKRMVSSEGGSGRATEYREGPGGQRNMARSTGC